MAKRIGHDRAALADLPARSGAAAARGAGARRAALPLLFFLAVAMLYPFAVGPDARLLAAPAPG
jgi:heme exporter protein B